MSNVEAIKKALEVAETLREYTDIDANEGANRDVVAASYAACETISELLTTLEALQRENAKLRQSQSYTYIGRDGKSVLARDLEDRAETAEAEVKRLQAEIDRKSSMPGDHRYWEGRYRDEAAENERLREVLEPFVTVSEKWVDDGGWTELACKNDRIVDWFGATDFLRARTALASAGEHHAE